MSDESSALPPRAAAYKLATGYWASLMVQAMAELGLAALLADGPRRPEELAAATGTQPPNLARLLRALASLGLLEQETDGAVRLSPAGEYLRPDVPDSLHALTLLVNAPWYRESWAALLHTVRTGQPAFPHVHGVTYWDYLADHPAASAIFDAAMTDGSEARARLLLSVRDLSEIGTLVDIGGGQGRLLAVVLRERPHLRGILFDRADVVAGAEPVLRAAGVADRCAIVAGDFFQEAAPGGDAYILSQILHDWPDAEVSRILGVCHAVMRPGARLWVIERVVSPDPGYDPVKMADLNMMVLFAAGERTLAEYQSLLEAAGFASVSAHGTDGPWRVIEAFRPE